MELLKRNDGGELSQFNYYDNLFSPKDFKLIEEYLNSLIFIKGRRYSGAKIDREQLWFHNDGKYFCEAWKSRDERWMAHNYDYYLDFIEKELIKKTNIFINSCLINKYKDGNDLIPPHKDNSYSFGEYPKVLIFSVGSEREIKFTSDIDNSTFSFKLKPNSLFIMSGGSQKYFTHEILKNDTKNVRYSLTFRDYIK